MTTTPIFTRDSLPQRRVVVTGVGALTPLGLSIEETWKNALAGQSGIAKITRFDSEKLDVKIAGEVKNFSPDAYVPNKKEQKKLELFSHYAVAATSMALKNAQLTITDELSPMVGALVGVGMGGLPYIEEQVAQFLTKGPGRISPFFVPVSITNMASGHISMLFNINGPNFAVTSACASGAHAIGEATEYIRRGQCKVMIAGGSESTVCALAIGGFAAMKALSKRNDDPTRASRPFDEGRDGFVLAEGASILILEDYEFAIQRGAPILCEVTGYGASSDAHHITNPSPVAKGAVLAITGALKNAGLAPKDVQYINAHGTSTPVGDEIETMAVKNVFGDAAKKVWISSTKSMMGHALGAAGAIEAALCVMAIKDQIVPPTINLENPSPNCDLDYVPHRARDGKIINVLNNSFGFGGTNASLIFSKIID